MDNTQLEHGESPNFRVSKELKTDLKQNTRTFVTEMTRRLSESFRLKEKDEPKDLTASYGLLEAIKVFESVSIFVRGMIYAKGRRDLISEEQMKTIKDFYQPDGVLNQLMTAVRQDPDFDRKRQASEINRYQYKLRTGGMAAPITPLSIRSLSFWQAFKEGKFEKPRAITGRHVAMQKAGKEQSFRIKSRA